MFPLQEAANTRMISQLLSKVIYLGLGKLYPAYASYKAVKTKNVKEYVKWMMYWIVFALFTSLGTFIDFFFSCFPFYSEEDENTAREITKITRKWKTSNVCFSSDAESDNSDFQPAVEEI